MTVLQWAPFSDADVRLALFTAVFLIALGAGLGLVVGSADSHVAVAAQEQYGRSAVNVTFTAVKEQVRQNVIPPAVGIGAYVAVILGNNLMVMGLAAYAYRILSMPLAITITSYTLLSSGFIPAMIGVRVASQYGLLAALAALAPHGGIELCALAIAGALGLLAATRADAPDVRERVHRVFTRRVLPMIAVASVIEIVVTPFVVLMVMH